MSKSGPAQAPGKGGCGPADALREQVLREQQLLLEALEHSQERAQSLNRQLLARQCALEEEVLRQLTQQQVTASQLAASRNRLASLVAEIDLCTEQTRRQIARQLHDQVVQRLALGKIKLDLALKRQLIPDSSEVRELSSVLRDCMKDLRELTFELSPPALHQFGLKAALDSLGSRFSREHGFQFVLSGTPEEPDLPEELRIALYQMARELLINVVKHAGASRVALELEQEPALIRLVVEDNGVGFDSTRSAGGFGLPNIVERADLLGGRLEIASKPGAGSRLEVAIPTRGRAAATGSPTEVP